MWEQDWALLGIAPTTELAAIKKAYALKLKTTRPDDDAAAYQALRGAYERAQQWVKWQTSQPADAADTESPVAEAATPIEIPVDTPVAEPVQDDSPPAPLSPADTVQQLNTLWLHQGSSALEASWPAVHAMLDAQPLAGRAAWSAHFANWVAQQDALPDAFVDALDGYFGWQEDFRVERQIGPQLAEAVQQALRERKDRPEPPSEEVHELVKPLRQLDQRRQDGASMLWLAALLQPMLTRLLAGLDPRTLGLCGVDLDMRRSLEKQLQCALMLRVGLLGALVFATFVLVSDDQDLAVLRMTMWAVWGTGWLGAAYFLGLFMHHGVSLQRPGRPALAMPLQRWRRHRRQPAVGLGLLVIAAVLAAFRQGWDLTTAALPVPGHVTALLQLLLDATPWLLLWLGAALAWPLHPAFSPVCLGLLVPVGALLFRWASPDDPWAAVMAIAVLYVLVGAARFEGRLGGNVVLDYACRAVTNTLAMAQRWGWLFAMLPSLLTLAYLFSSRPPPPVTHLVLAWVLLTLAVHYVQHRVEAWALARLSRASTPSRPDSASA